MASALDQIFLILLLSAFLASARYLRMPENADPSDLPPGFLFGTSSSAYQYEGAYFSDGKGLNNWDVFTHLTKKVTDLSNGDIATDHYHHYQEDVDLMANLEVNSYRFSISWARILPRGRYGDVNRAGIDFYNRLINALLRKGIQPFVTLCHFDIPQELEDSYGSWLSPKIAEDFRYYVDICFKFFGDRVKHWITFNEPNILLPTAYRWGNYPPGRCSAPFGNCTAGDSETEPFIAGHNLILAHAAAVDLYRTKYQREQGGMIGIVLEAIWYEPVSNSSADKLATQRANSFFTNWFLDPIIFGDYPVDMKTILGPSLPEFSPEERKKLHKALDFIGLNHYTSFYIKDCMFSECKPGEGTTRTEGLYKRVAVKDGIPIGEPTAMSWMHVYPEGMEKMVNYMKDRYNNTPMFITENGYPQDSNRSSHEELLSDFKRVDYLDGYLASLLKAIREGADVRGYSVWSLLDNFEWLEGYTKRFGLHYVDYATFKRTPKLSAAWYRRFIAKHKMAKSLKAATI
ncbi:hypothetical protein Ancab_004936 [Ancistrocladus abbreviatus]